MFKIFKNKDVAEAVDNLNKVVVAKMNEDKVWTAEELKVSEKAVGGDVSLISEDGTLVPAPDGEYNYDGDVLTVKDGKVEAVNGKTEEKVEETEAEVEAETEETPAEETPAEPNEVEALNERLSALENKFDELLTAIGLSATKEDVNQYSSKIEALEAKFSTTNELLNKILKVPVEMSKTTQSNIIKDTNTKKVSEIKNAFGLKK